MTDIQQLAADREAEDLAFQRLFDPKLNPDATLVMNAIIREGKAFGTTYKVGEKESGVMDMVFREGRKSLALKILQKAKWTSV